MPYAYSLKGKRQRLTEFRTGGINAAGGVPVDPRVIKHRSVVAAQMGCLGTSAGSHGAFSIGAWNTPVELITAASWNVIGAVGRHPSGHVEILADGYSTHKVMKSHYRFDITWHAAADRVQDYGVFAYKFSADSSVSEPAFPATLATGEVWLDMQSTAGWVWDKFGTSGLLNGTPRYPLAITVNVDIPNVSEIVWNMQTAALTSADKVQLKGNISDSSAVPPLEAFLHFVAFLVEKDGVPSTLTVNDIVVNVRCTQTVMCYKEVKSSDMIDEGDDDE